MNKNTSENKVNFSDKNLQELREFIKSLGDNVIEEKREHRISYSKSLTFRVFAEIKTNDDKIFLTLKKDRKEQPKTYTIVNKEDLTELSETIKEAYEKIN